MPTCSGFDGSKLNVNHSKLNVNHGRFSLLCSAQPLAFVKKRSSRLSLSTESETRITPATNYCAVEAALLLLLPLPRITLCYGDVLTLCQPKLSSPQKHSSRGSFSSFHHIGLFHQSMLFCLRGVLSRAEMNNIEARILTFSDSDSHFRIFTH